MSQKHRRGARKWVLLALCVLFAAGLIEVARIQWMIHSGKHLGGNEPVDVGIVLGAALWHDVPSPGLKERLDHALELYNAGRFPTFIVTGGLDTGGATITEAEGMKRYLMQQGVPEKDILTEPLARSTYQNLSFSKKLMESHHLHTAVIITHSYHGARAADMAKFIGFEPVQTDTCETKVMSIVKHRLRETLAFGKWDIDKVLLRTGVISGEV
ncbi:YdcF family protein [Gorillibacterium massiliense]|uniref:YdcF family protein n=1 Tax=Gorillibacterium massiliense TaxID=1280390 RepID=UPI0004B08FEF|nr:YdcF family protein [Gorillibacterium massiliense]